MAEHSSTDKHGNTETGSKNSRRGPSVLLLLAGLAALLVSGWALIGPFSLAPLGNVEFRWILVAVALVVGAALVFSPGKRSR